jgi:alkylated DNA repair dioxygenase AlkB
MKQADLFADDEDDPALEISGLSYIADYMTVDQAHALLSALDKHDWFSDLKRRVQHHGYKYDYKARTVNARANLEPMPSWASDLCLKLTEDGIFPVAPDQVIVNEYLPGQGISAHVDCVPCFGDYIASLSLSSPCIMEFSNPVTREKREVWLEPRSLVVLSGDARYKWHHAIPGRKSDVINGVKFPRQRRVSLTFRKMIFSP